MHSFVVKWLDEYGQDRLAYSVENDAAYCKYCKLFPGGERGILVEKPFCKWKDAICEFNAHFWVNQVDKTKGCRGNKLHRSAVVRATEFIKHIEGDQQQICQVMDMKSQTQIKQNREVVKSIAKTLHFLAKQNFSLQGHRDDSQYSHLEGGNPGNFQELLQFWCESGDDYLKVHFEEGHKMQHVEAKQFKMNSSILLVVKYWKVSLLMWKQQSTLLYQQMKQLTEDCRHNSLWYFNMLMKKVYTKYICNSTS